MSFEQLTTLIGANNAGKSTVLHAIKIFFDASPKISLDDFYLNDATKEITITIEFKDLTPLEMQEFGNGVINDIITITRAFKFKNGNVDSSEYYVTARVFPPFGDYRTEANGTKKRGIYSKLREQYSDLPVASSVANQEEGLANWEKNNPEKLKAKRLRGFFGATNVAVGKLKKKTSVHFVPAVKDAVDEFNTGKNSPVNKLLSAIVKQTIDNKMKLQEYLEEAQKKVTELLDPENVPGLKTIGADLTASINQIYSDTTIKAKWNTQDSLAVNYPKPEISLEHMGHNVKVEYVGHGLQRAVLFSVIKYLAEQNADADDNDESTEKTDSFDKAFSDIILLIEEPEIYQHPLKQSIFYEVLSDIATSFNKLTGIRIQVVFSTHSEKMIKFDRFSSARIIRKKLYEGNLQTSVQSLSISATVEAFAGFFDPPIKPMSNDAFCSKLHIFTREVCEGFFADKIILVEGVVDKAVMEGLYLSAGCNVNVKGIAVISVEGKGKLDKPAYIFRKLGIPVFTIFDNDNSEYTKEDQKKARENNSKLNILLQKIYELPKQGLWPIGVYSEFCAFDGSLETYIKSQSNEQYDSVFDEIAAEYKLSRRDLKKSPAAFSQLIFKLKEKGCTFDYFDQILEKIEELS